MKTRTLLLLALVIAIAFTGIAMADSSGSTPVSGTVEAPTLTLTAPTAVAGWSLLRGTNNDLSIGSVYVHTNDVSGIQCKVTVTSDNGGRMYLPGNYGSYLQTPLNIWDGSWQPLTSPVIIWTSSSLGTSDTPIPVNIRQTVTSSDIGQPYTIVLTFTLSQTT
jgi:hypothetical protein